MVQFLVLALGDSKHVTHSVPKTLCPEWNEQCQLPITGVQSLLLSVCCWDKDRFGKDYLGEFDLALEEIFADEKTEQPPKWYPLKSKRPGKKTGVVSGEVQLQFSLVDSTSRDATEEQILQKFAAIAKSAPAGDSSSSPTPSRTPVLDPDRKGKSPSPTPPLDDGRADDNNDDEDDDETYEDETPEDEDPSKPETAEKRRSRLRIRGLKRKKRESAYEFTNSGSDVVGIIFLEIANITDLPPESNLTKTSFDMDPFVVVSLGKQTYRTRTIWHNLNPVFNEKMIFQVLNHEQSYSFSFTVIDHDKYSGNDFIASVNFPVKELIEKAPKADPETGLYNLKEVPEFSSTPAQQRPRFRRLGLSRTSSTQSLGKGGRPTLSKNSSSTTANSPSATTPAASPGPSSQHQAESIPEGAQSSASSNGFLQPGDNGVATTASAPGEASQPETDDPDFLTYTLPLKMKNLEKWEDRHNPQLTIRAKYMPYAALRQQFWRAMLKQYDADESGLISKVELTTMLDTLGSTLRDSTIDSFFQRFPHKASDRDDAEDLTMDEAVICLEDQLHARSRPQSAAERAKKLLPDADRVKSLVPLPGKSTPSGSETPAGSLEAPSDAQLADQSTITVPELSTPGEEGELLERDDLNISTSDEHVVEIRECPICHQPRLDKRRDADIITHIATCASQDWRQVNNLMMGGFVTSSQAQRKWYSKVITKISYGGYKLGANSANILVQDRITGQINEEKMSVYVRLGIRLLYKGLKANNMEKKRSECAWKALGVVGVRWQFDLTGPKSASSSRVSASSRARSTTTRRPRPRSPNSSPSTASTCPKYYSPWRSSRTSTSSSTAPSSRAPAPARRPTTRASSCLLPTAGPSSSTASRRRRRCGSRDASSASSASWATRTRRTWGATRTAGRWASSGSRRRTTTASTFPSTASWGSPRPSRASTTRSTRWRSARLSTSTARTCAFSCPSTALISAAS